MAATPVVLYNGSYEIKGGFAGNDSPAVVFKTLVAGSRGSSGTGDALVGNEVAASRDDLEDVRSVIKEGLVTDDHDIELVWRHAYSQLGVSLEEHPLLLTEAVGCPFETRQRLSQILFESMDVPALYWGHNPVLALHSYNLKTGLVVDSGYDSTSVIPINNGTMVNEAINVLELAGKGLSNYLEHLLEKRYYSFSSWAQKYQAEQMKETLCYVSLDVHDEFKKLSTESNNTEKTFKMKDGTVIALRKERFVCPEALFAPNLIGLNGHPLHKLIQNAVSKSDEDVRPLLYSNIILSGGTAEIPGIKARLEEELNTAGTNQDINVTSPKWRYAAWKGGSMLAADQEFVKNEFLTKASYEEHGDSVLKRF
ncbi:actin-1-like [Haliotis asinina]|uniref:actin-1-like n=1 Tax=Haliotis asinina TaxID=109174 RepID=UPI0035326DB5